MQNIPDRKPENATSVAIYGKLWKIYYEKREKENKKYLTWVLNNRPCDEEAVDRTKPETKFCQTICEINTFNTQMTPDCAAYAKAI